MEREREVSQMEKKIWLDMDGTIADLYGVEGWLNMLIDQDPTPYRMAEPMLNMSALARLLHKAQRLGYEVGIISWLSKTATAEYDLAVTQAKVEWLELHLPSVEWNEIKIVAYGTPKHELCKGMLFDDEEHNRREWGIGAYEPCELLEILRGLE
jgi:hypothetical protein